LAVALDLRESLWGATVFDVGFWTRTLTLLGYQVKAEDLDIATLKEQRAIPSDVSLGKVTRLFANDYVEVALLDFHKGSKITRSVCTRIARSWKANRLTKPLLFFTNGEQSFAVIVPGKGTSGETKVLGVSDRLYRTDFDVIESMAYPGNDEELNKRYDATFFPYEKVRDEFFEGYRELYHRIEKAVRKHVRSASTSYAQSFLGRLMFLYFLQRKGWLNDDKNFIDGIKDYRELNELLYESLNKGGTPGVPFLNGSLFEKEEFMDEEMETRLFADMDVLFKEARAFFDQYNFTVDELAPLEVDVSIDPALIGTVFENMLPEYERGSKGTFYTPRSEASFICRRALANYLGYRDEVSPDGKKFRDGLALYLDQLRESKSEKEVREFREKLLSLRVVDPAVGSGGFLLVMMQEIVRLIQEAEVIVGWTSDPEEHKKRILPNLYGFDIEPEAIEIARLRLWLSLIIDQKEPEPLPNLDMNLIVINDSLRLPTTQGTLNPEVEELRVRRNELKAKYLNEHESGKKSMLREQLQKISNELAKRTGEDPDVIEAHLQPLADIVVMNPPYVRQEAIPEKSKANYVAKYGLDKKSDLFAYFLVRSLQLVSEDGVVSVISSDKWLETGYGVSLQRKLKDNLIAIYGQKERSFGADINTVITVYTREGNDLPVHFTYLESYAEDEVRQDTAIEKENLRPGKWFYLRAPKVFMEKILPKLTHKLGDFAEIRFGIKTGANEFFYMKDISHLYEADHLANPRKFEEWGVKAKTRKDLERQGLIYIENEGGERYILNKEDVMHLIRSSKQMRRYLIPKPTTLCLYTSSPGDFTKMYLSHGQETRLTERPSIKNRDPWFKPSGPKPTRILLPKLIMDKVYVPISEVPALCDNNIYNVEAPDPEQLFLFLNSIVFLIGIELYCQRMGGGAAAIMVDDYDKIPVPDLNKTKIEYPLAGLLSREVHRYSEEVRQDDRKELDISVLRALGFVHPEGLLAELYGAFLEVVDDRIVKAGHPLKRVRKNVEEENPE